MNSCWMLTLLSGDIGLIPELWRVLNKFHIVSFTRKGICLKWKHLLSVHIRVIQVFILKKIMNEWRFDLFLSQAGEGKSVMFYTLPGLGQDAVGDPLLLKPPPRLICESGDSSPTSSPLLFWGNSGGCVPLKSRDSRPSIASSRLSSKFSKSKREGGARGELWALGVESESGGEDWGV